MLGWDTLERLNYGIYRVKIVPTWLFQANHPNWAGRGGSIVTLKMAAVFFRCSLAEMLSDSKRHSAPKKQRNRVPRLISATSM
jgi:hypothetical protein